MNANEILMSPLQIPFVNEICLLESYLCILNTYLCILNKSATKWLVISFNPSKEFYIIL